ncbi:sodium-dependent transporter [Hathewaya limosa]|uniref:Transporter n=1 Tax=Hathewaya limosa TaxID=1536 RepID=A0ABU0JVM7_HATLI|nr:sodium-dependent transporter [Hathewaya limosa]MDQ0480490.1 NSS family neurotransmitter:Na+ symporter [Hathewaya limosa]
MRREGFGTKLGILAATAGSAVGLGNIWKFPYITGVNGGAAFLIVYLFFVFLIGMPIVVGEFALGRKGQANAVQCFKNIMPKKFWHLVGGLSTFTAFIILSFYSMIAGWVLAYIGRSLTGILIKVPVENLESYFTSITSSYEPLIWTFVVLLITGLVVVSGVKNGIEKYSKILMPILFGLLIVLMIRSLTLDGAYKGVEFLFKPDFSKLTGKSILEALGHSFYTLSIAMGILITFGSYIDKKENLVGLTASITVADTLVALMAGMVIFPAVFAYGLEPAAGPKLIFITIPAVFKSMPLGNLFEILFFILIAVAAITSTIALLEVVVAALTEQLKMNRKKVTFIVVLLIFFLSIPSVLSFGVWSNVKIFGKVFFDLFDFIASNVFLPLGGLLICIFIGWIWGIDEAEKEITSDGTYKLPLKSLYAFIIKFAAPICIVVIFLYSIGVIG